ncbi:MAG TPA: adenylyltransferase/cytidyltransferase family protein [Candidatus Dormibacteraeota bacterium]|jgi:rfaE bifunctional protein nucleotidyltransferase chain/domain|nr:adenylyltransferase/cytidyltransferase family protein [Candidatus Dormibacteraeota bacterium]
MLDTSKKIVNRETLREVVAGLRHSGATIVFANGCFDTLHVGHVRYLEGAKAEGDILIVGVNADESVLGLKGPGRPILDENARARLVASVRAVDYVVLFADANVEALLDELRPNVHAKGTDYTQASVPERATAEMLGIRIAIVGDPKDHSTRELIETVRKAPHA